MSFVVMTLLVLMILASVVAMIAQGNMRQAIGQDNSLQAYYNARSGAEIAFEALWQEKTGVTPIVQELRMAPADQKSRTATIDLSNTGLTSTSGSAPLSDAGSAAVTMTYAIDKKTNEETITISSVGTYRGRTRKVELKVYFSYDSETGKSTPKEFVWSR